MCLAALRKRVLLFALYVLHMITAVRFCSYRSWRKAGAPNPFLPRELKQAVARFEYEVRQAKRSRARSTSFL